MGTTSLLNRFREIYGTTATLYFAPGRVNIIGEHTDYNGGYVLPCAINFGTYLAIALNKDNVFRFETMNYDYKTEIKIEDLKHKHEDEWVNYPLGVIDQFIKKGNYLQHGADMLYSGDFPDGAGLSSSASIELVTAVALNEVFHAGMENIELVRLSHKAEKEFVGRDCGIMDQFAAGMGRANSAILLNCRSLEYEFVPIDLKDYSIIIMNTNKSRDISGEIYNERVSECKKALETLRKMKPEMDDLSDITQEEFDKFGSVITDPVIFNRARHVISENQRVLNSVEALKKGDLFSLGQLMNDSHESLRHDFQVTGVELDTIVNAARKVNGVIGASMTGPGFGGCAIALVNKRYVEALINKVGPAYEKEIGLKPLFYVTNLSDGARKIELL